MIEVPIADDEIALERGGVRFGGAEDGPDDAGGSGARLLTRLVLTATAAGAAILLLAHTVLSSPGSADPSDSTAAAPIGEPVEPQAVDPAGMDHEVTRAVAAALDSQSIATLPFAYERPADVAAEFNRITEGLGEFTLAASVGPLDPDDGLRRAGPVNLEWTLSDGTVFATEGELRLVRVGREWQVDWDPAVLHAGLTPGDVFVRERVTSPRAPILGAGGFELVGPRPVVEIGVMTGDVASIEELSVRLAELLDVDRSELTDRLTRSPSDAITQVAVRRVADVDSLTADLVTLPGVVLTESTATLTPHDGYGRALLGWNGEVTAEILERSPDHFAIGDLVGRSGVQAVYNERLAGLPGSRIRIDRRFPLRDSTGREIAPDAPVNIVHLSAPRLPEPVETTIDHRYQTAAEGALQATGLSSSLVAVRVSTGEVLAVANGPGAAVENRALTGRYPPGSIFKVVTAHAALESGGSADQPIGCPSSLVVEGREFRNSEGKDRGTVSLRDAFAHSCNTSFIELGTAMHPETLPRVARELGVGVEYRLGTVAFAGSVPVPESAVDRAATSFGQGRVLVSPLSMAVMAATVAGGTYRPPTLVVGANAGAGEVRALDPVVAESLRDMMGAVVDYGTGRSLRGVPGGRVHGKTGTAEFGDGDRSSTHAWFVGFQDDIAFAVIVDGGGFGGSVAAPIAAEFLRRAAGRG